jgi:drug/metabolite transporter (DMT)-like permease
MNKFYLVCMISAYVGLSGARDVWLHRYTDSQNLSDYLLLSFLPVVVVTAVVWLLRKKQTGTSVYNPQTRRHLMYLNITTAATYVFAYASLTLAHARTASSVGIAMVPIFTLAIGKSISRRVGACVAIIIGCFVLSWHELVLPFIHNRYLTLVGLIAAVVAGLFAALNIVFSSKLGRLGIKPETIFATRFLLLVVGAGISSAILHLLRGASTSLNANATLWVVPFVGLAGIVMPLYVFQHIIALSSRIASFVVPMVPLTVFGLELFGKEAPPFSIFAMVGVLLTSGGIYLGLRQIKVQGSARAA